MKRTRLDQLKPQMEGSVRKETREEFVVSALNELSEKTCALIWESDMSLVKYHFDLYADFDTDYIENGLYKSDLLTMYESMPADENLYFVIHMVDKMDDAGQMMLYSLIKDRCINTFDDLPDEIKVVLTISSEDSVKNIVYPLWNFASNLL